MNRYGTLAFFGSGRISEVIPEAAEVYGKGQLVEEAIRTRAGKWHHARCGIGEYAVEYHLTHCGLRLRPEHGWRDAHAVPTRQRCKRCDWTRV